jgi:peptidoglycan/LPS O-acetylase OafA/YrhL
VDQPKRANSNFDLIRLIAASAVVLSHSLVVVKGSAWWFAHPMDPLRELGDDAVAVFFVVSGFLVTQSWQRDPDLPRYLARRALRMVPGLLVAVVLTSFVFGLVATSLSAAAYLGHPGTWSYLLNGSLLAGIDQLPGVFVHLPLAGEVNGSLWTLRYEFLCYLLVPLVLALALNVWGRRAAAWAMLVAGVAGTCLLTLQPMLPIMGADPFHLAGMLGESGFKFTPVADLLGFFLIGMCFHLFRDVIRWRRDVAILCVPAFIVTTQFGPLHMVAMGSLAYAVIYFATRAAPLGRGVTRLGDASFGVYLYGFPISQLVVVALGAVWFPVVFAVSLPLAYGAGLLSWRVVERRALQHRPRGARLSPPMVRPAPAVSGI